MKTKIYLLLIFLFNICCVYSDIIELDERNQIENQNIASFDDDEKVLSIINSNEFINTQIYYKFEGIEYPVRIINNPKEEILWGEDLKEPTNLSMIMMASLPLPLLRHLEDLVLENRGNLESCYLSLKNEFAEEWELIRPVYIATEINDRSNDEIGRTAFHSNQFENIVLYYYLDDQFYQVRLLNNPEGRNFSTVRKYSLDPDGPLRSFSFSWKKKYAIIVSKEAPKELIKHLGKLLKHISYWDWYFNFNLENGTYVKYVLDGGYETITYSLDTWFNFSEDFVLKQKVAQ